MALVDKNGIEFLTKVDAFVPGDFCNFVIVDVGVFMYVAVDNDFKSCA